MTDQEKIERLVIALARATHTPENLLRREYGLEPHPHPYAGFVPTHAHTVQSDATERSATVDESPAEAPRSAQEPQTASVDLDALAHADRACLCVIHLKDWRGGYGHTERQTNDNCPTHGDAA